MIRTAEPDPSSKQPAESESACGDGSSVTSRHRSSSGEADYFDKEFTAAVECLKDLYAKSYEVADYAVALRVRKELNQLLRLHDRPGDEDRIDPNVHDELVRVLELVRGHLVPLGLAKESNPVQEHARMAAAYVMNHLCESGQ